MGRRGQGLGGADGGTKGRWEVRGGMGWEPAGMRKYRLGHSSLPTTLQWFYGPIRLGGASDGWTGQPRFARRIVRSAPTV